MSSLTPGTNAFFYGTRKRTLSTKTTRYYRPEQLGDKRQSGLKLIS
ncbi:MAG: hypothetical protein ACKVHR_08065 [Pirellulales bacterium]